MVNFSINQNISTYLVTDDSSVQVFLHFLPIFVQSFEVDCAEVTQ